MEKYEIVNHGYDHSQYFQGCGTYGTEFEHCVTGCGDNAKEAYEDAVEQVHQILPQDEARKLKLPLRPTGIRASDHVPTALLREEHCDHFWYVSIRF